MVDIEEPIKTPASTDSESEPEPAEDQNDEMVTTAGTGLASVFADILKKPTAAKKKSVILHKGQTDKEIAKRKRAKEEGEDDATPKKWLNLQEQHAKRKEWEDIGHVKPHVLDKEKERKLQRIGTSGVVQLFNAVKKHQKTLEKKVEGVGSSEFKQEKVMKSLNKGDFIDMLKGKSPKDSILEHDEGKEIKKEIKGENPTWSILRDDFMMGAKMKDWDKESLDEDGENIDL